MSWFSRNAAATVSCAVCIVLASLLSAGCGGATEGPALYPVTGTVTLNGEPIEEGRIQFREQEGDRRAFSGQIVDGEYSLEAEPGSMDVQIYASRIVPGKFDTSNPDDDPQPVGEMYIPEKYNSRTTLTAEVSASGDNNIPFELTSE
jgi:hypothetical protein